MFDFLPEAGWRAMNNYWGTTDEQNILSRLSNDPVIEPIEDQTYPCERHPNDCTLDGETMLFRSGWEQEREAQFNAALTSYEQLIDQYPQGKYAKVALERIAFCKKATNSSWQEIRSYFLNLAADSSKDSSLVILCKSNAAWCLAELDQYDQAYQELDSLLDHTETSYLRLSLSLKLLLAELREDDYGFLYAKDGNRETSNGLDNADAIFAAKFRRIERQVDSLLSLFKGAGEQQISAVVIPAVYALYQNYPNPFNPNTEIKLDLPEDVHIKLKIFNTLGQHVTTLADEVRPAGAYRLMWDGKDSHGTTVASGVYVYQINAGNFTDAKKMALIR
jgi:tetratricopeptide (TPR) repeat protein